MHMPCRAEVSSYIPADNIGIGDDMAGAAVHLASRADDYVVGSELVVDSWIAHAPPLSIFGASNANSLRAFRRGLNSHSGIMSPAAYMARELAAPDGDNFSQSHPKR